MANKNEKYNKSLNKTFIFLWNSILNTLFLIIGTN